MRTRMGEGDSTTTAGSSSSSTSGCSSVVKRGVDERRFGTAVRTRAVVRNGLGAVIINNFFSEKKNVSLITTKYK